MSEDRKARERLEALGFEIGPDGSTVELGHDSIVGRRRRNPDGYLDPHTFGPWGLPTTLEVRCGVGPAGGKSCASPLLTLWDFEDQLWADVPLFGHSVRDRLDELARRSDATIGVVCAAHGVARLSLEGLRLAAAATRRFLYIDVSAGRWG